MLGGFVAPAPVTNSVTIDPALAGLAALFNELSELKAAACPAPLAFAVKTAGAVGATLTVTGAVV